MCHASASDATKQCVLDLLLRWVLGALNSEDIKGVACLRGTWSDESSFTLSAHQLRDLFPEASESEAACAAAGVVLASRWPQTLLSASTRAHR